MRIDKDVYKKAVDETMEQMKSQEMYLRFVSLAGTSHLSARNLAAVLHGNPDAEEVGTLQYWNKRNRIVIFSGGYPRSGSGRVMIVMAPVP